MEQREERSPFGKPRLPGDIFFPGYKDAYPASNLVLAALPRPFCNPI